VVARAVIVVVVDAFGLSTGLDGVPHVAVGPKVAPDRRCSGSAPPPCAPDAEKEVGSGRVWTALLSSRASSAGVRLSSPLVVPHLE
jgi:hypothetical protein